MTKRILKNLDKLKTLYQCNKAEQKHFLKIARPETINTLCDCIHNILKGKVNLTQDQKRKLSSKKKILRKLTDRKNKVPQRKKLLIQHGGGFLNYILGPVIKTIASILN